ncbi:MAG: 4-alpha-glucanotransferase [Lachnospiraceae bacterium]|nr:4-alpha-glucanotransferase [Lachnospiraceae bacterium]
MRKSGILMHISSLPSPYGVGSMGRAAYEFVDFLTKAGQKVWQMLPIHPTGYGDSPYQALSTFAGNHYFIDLDILKEEGLLNAEDLGVCEEVENPQRVDYSVLYEQRLELLEKAYSRFKKNAEYEKFVEKQSWWLEDYALFMALKTEFEQKPWTEWDEDIKFRKSKALTKYREKLRETIELHYFIQYEFYKQWDALHRYAAKQGIDLIGDVPIYVPMDSADVWSAPDFFQLDEERQPVVIAGCPPDAFSATGQRWGNPIYDWNKMEQDGFAWWIRRLQCAGSFFDIVRIDHFRGIESYWAIPAQEETAMNGQWRKGPGMALINTIKTALPKVHFIAEDLGFLTPEVIQMQKESGFPGMKILQFAFDSRESGNYMPYTYSSGSVCYTGTHDNETLVQWLETISPEDLDSAREYLQWKKGMSLPREMIRLGMSTVCELFVAQLQDYLELGAWARMNKPSSLDGKNWVWRATKEQLSDELADEILKLTILYGR